MIALLADIRRAYIPIEQADRLVAAIRLRAMSLMSERSPAQSNPGNHSHTILTVVHLLISLFSLLAQHPVTLPSNLNVIIPSNHEASRYNGFVYVYPVETNSGPFYVVTHGRLVGVISHWYVYLYVCSDA